MNTKVVLIFTKVPSSGFVKTRLTQGTCLSNDEVVLLAKAMLKDTIALASKSNTDRIDLGYIPETGHDLLKQIVNEVNIDKLLTKPVEYHSQVGSNFNDRFGSVVSASFAKRATEMIILGSDLPFLDPSIINTAFNYLLSNKREKKLVLGPASSGGIYLVGINTTFNPLWFSKYELFSGGIEISQFITFSKIEKFSIILLPAFGDIDLEEDLVSLMLYIEALSISQSYTGYYFPKYTAKIIKNLELYVKEIEGETRNRKIAKK
jgi:hypothetical protein